MLVHAHGGRPVAGWWDQIRPYSLGWVTARLLDQKNLVGFVNVAWDGGDHAFLLDAKVAGSHQRQGIAAALVGHAVGHARAASGSTSTSASTWPRSTSVPAASGPPQPG
jgi:ribosomal protein S18 acetylase RimI-like enzyme